MAAPETQGKRTVFIILVSSCVFFSADKVIRLVRFQGRQGGFMSSKAQTRERDYDRGLRIADRRGMLMSAIHEENGEERLNLVMLNDAIPAGAKLE